MTLGYTFPNWVISDDEESRSHKSNQKEPETRGWNSEKLLTAKKTGTWTGLEREDGSEERTGEDKDVSRKEA